MAEPVRADIPSSLVERVASLLAAADHVLIAAGAGASVDAGFDYNSESQFVGRYPVMARRGPRCRYHMFGFPWPSPSVQWGHLARHLEELRYSPPPNAQPYQQLRALTSGKDCFVLTSNADDLFERHGFDPALIWTRQGSYSRLQCLEPCSPASTWDAGPWVARAAPEVDLRTEELSDPALIPACPRCGGEAMLNVRGGDWFVETPYLVQGERFDHWLSKAQGNLLILDVGTGFNTPSVIRWPAERITASLPRANLVRINPLRPEVPGQLGNRALGIPASGAALWSKLVTAQPR